MKKNAAAQVVVAQLVSKTDGSAVTTGTTLVYVLGDGGTQALGEGTGSPSGQAIHEGQGVWSYPPTQAETNYDHVAFTFVNSTAINATVQIYTSFPQTGDNYARLGAPAGASVSADVAAVKAVLPAALVSGRIDASVGAMAANTLTATAIAADAITDAKVASDVTIASVTGAVGSVTGAVGSVTGNVGGNVTGSVGSVTGNVGGNVVGSVASVTARVTANTDQLAGQTVTAAAGVTFPTSVASPTNITAASGVALTAAYDAAKTAATQASVDAIDDFVDTEVSAIKSVTDKLDSTLQLDNSSPTVYQFTTIALENGPSGSGPTAADIADAVWDEATAGHATAGSTGKALTDAGSAGDPWASVIEGSYTASDLLRVLAAVMAGKTTISGTTVTFRDVTDASDIVTAGMSGSERQTVTLAP